MTPAVAALDRALTLGVHVRANGPKLRILVPDDLPEAEWESIRDDLAEHKAEVLELLADPTVEALAVWSSPDCPAFAFDDSLAVSASEVLASISEVLRMEVR
jgi:hypothetical protein